MKPVRLFKKLGAAFAVGLIALGLVAGTASTAGANGGVSGEISKAVNGTEAGEDPNGGVSGEISDGDEDTNGGVSGEISDVTFSAAVSGEIS